MKTVKVLLILIWAVSTQSENIHAQSFVTKTHSLTVKGTSSLHDWESAVEKVDAAGSYRLTDNALTQLGDVVVKIPVKSIKSTKGKMMDNKTWEAFNHEKYPFVVLSLTKETINFSRNTVRATANLTMAGVTKAIHLELNYKVLPGGELEVTGSQKLKMTDYKMEPPTAMMGTIKVGDEVEVIFKIVLKQENNSL